MYREMPHATKTKYKVAWSGAQEPKRGEQRSVLERYIYPGECCNSAVKNRAKHGLCLRWQGRTS